MTSENKVEKNTKSEAPKQRLGRNDVFIGNKRLMDYVTGVLMQLNSGSKEVTIKARGKYITRAVDVAEVVRNRFMKETVIKEIKIGSDEFDGREGKKVRISTIDIVLIKK